MVRGTECEVERVRQKAMWMTKAYWRHTSGSAQEKRASKKEFTKASKSGRVGVHCFAGLPGKS